MTGLASGSPAQFTRAMREAGLRRGLLWWDAESATLQPSSPALAELAAAVRALPDFDAHEALLFEIGAETEALHTAVLHDTTRGQGQGGLRHWRYESVQEVFRDGLRLAQGMGRKCALAGLWWGGGKGVMVPPDGVDERDPGYRRAAFLEYGRFVSGIGGVYVTAEDVGTTPADVATLFETTRFATCIPREAGGSGNPSERTAEGVVAAMEAAAPFAGLERGLSGCTVVLQGAGHVGVAVLERLLARGVVHVVIGDIAEARLAPLRGDERVEVRLVPRGDADLLCEPCDVLSPNALGGVIGPETVPRLQTRLICGAANNTLEDDERDGRALHERAIVYVPDFVANRMGIVQCANEQYGSLEADPAIGAHLDPGEAHSIQATTARVLTRAAAEGVPPVAAANALADERMREPHPLFPGRARQIVASLVAAGWADA